MTDKQARDLFERALWPFGPVCSHPSHRKANNLPIPTVSATLLNGTSHRPGLYRCNSCRRQFTVTVGTAYSSTHVPLVTWVEAIRLFQENPNLSAKHLQRTFELGSYETARRIKALIVAAMRKCHPNPSVEDIIRAGAR